MFLLSALTAVVVVAYPFWVFTIGVGSMINESAPHPRWLTAVLMMLPALLVAFLWLAFGATLSLIRPERQAEILQNR